MVAHRRPIRFCQRVRPVGSICVLLLNGFLFLALVIPSRYSTAGALVLMFLAVKGKEVRMRFRSRRRGSVGRRRSGYGRSRGRRRGNYSMKRRRGRKLSRPLRIGFRM